MSVVSMNASPIANASSTMLPNVTLNGTNSLGSPVIHDVTSAQLRMLTSGAQPYAPATPSVSPFGSFTSAVSDLVTSSSIGKIVTTIRSYLGASSRQAATQDTTTEVVTTGLGVEDELGASVTKEAQMITETSKPDDVQSEKIRVKRMYGDTTTEHQKIDLSFAATIYNSTTGYNYCSGTIVDDNTILTAAHCVYGKDKETIEVGVGSNILAEQTKLKVTDILINPEYAQAESGGFLDEDNCGDYCGDYVEASGFDEDVAAYSDTTSSDVPSLAEVLPVIEANTVEFYDGTIPAEKYDLALIKVADGEFKKLGLSVVPFATKAATDDIESLCGDSEKLRKERLWVAGSGIIDDKGDVPQYATEVTSGYVLFDDQQCATNTTLYTRYDYQNESAWCSGDSGAGVFRINPQTKHAELVGVVKSSGALGGHCIEHENFKQESFELRATRLTPSMTEFMQPRLSQNSGLKEWNGITPRYTNVIKPKVDCDHQNFVGLGKQAKVWQEEADACGNDQSLAESQECKAKKVQALKFQKKLEDRMNECRVKGPNNEKGLRLTRISKLEVEKHPEQVSCTITNLNNQDVLTFTPDSHHDKEVSIMPRETIHCPTEDGHSLTQGIVKKPKDQIKAAVASAIAERAGILGDEVLLIAKKYAEPEESFTQNITGCSIVNTGNAFLKFQPKDRQHVRVIPRVPSSCPTGDESQILEGRLLDPHVLEHSPELDFEFFQRVVNGTQKGVGVLLKDNQNTEGKAFIINNKFYTQHVGHMDINNGRIYILNTKARIITSVRLVETSDF